jgi:hypothetical protein
MILKAETKDDFGKICHKTVCTEVATNKVMKICGAVLNIPLTDHTVQTFLPNLNAELY